MDPNAFFTPGRTYTQSGNPSMPPAQARVFRCEHVFQLSGEPRAFGFITRADPGASWEETTLTAWIWNRGWEDITSVAVEPTTAAPKGLTLGSEEVGELFSAMVETVDLIWPGTLVMYHGDETAQRALYLADVCLCGGCTRNNQQTYTLLSHEGEALLHHIRRSSITPARIA